jgi:nucleoside-diphosphate-sugar epimerase
MARACLLSVETDKLKGCQVFNIVANTTTQKTASRDLARKYVPEAELRSGFEGNASFFSNEKAKRILGWRHDETE